MEMFIYQGRNRRGEVMRGSVESSSPQAVATWLTGLEIYPVSIKKQNQESAGPAWLQRLRGADKVSTSQLLLFTRQMANMVRAGMQLMDAIDGIQRTTDSPALAKVLRAVREDLDRGVVLSGALTRHPKVFNDYYVSMIRVGEGTGKLEEAFRNLYSQLDFDRDMRQRMKAALRYPTFVISAIVLALVVVTTFVIPAFAKTYANLKVQLPLITRMLLAFSNFVVTYWWALIFIAAVIYFILHLVLRQAEARYALDKWKLRFPLVGNIIWKGTVARFARSFSTAVKSDVPIVTAFTLVSRVVENTFFESRILQMRSAVERGETLSRAMRTADVFAPLEIQLITVAERTGEVDAAIEHVAKLYSDEVEYEVDKLSQTVEPLILGLMGVLVLMLVLGIFLPMWDLGQGFLRK